MNDKKFPLVSIITVTRNLIDAGRKDFFRQCVESVRMQDYPSIEHLIIDGASTDGSISLFEEMKLNYISEPDTGIHNATNKGIRLAKGKYVAFLCSDDYYICKDALSMAVAALEANNGDFTYAPTVCVDENNKQAISNPHWETVLNTTPFCTESMLASKEMLLNLNGFDERYVVFADYDLMLRAIQAHYNPIKVNQAFVAFRTTGVSGSPDKKIQYERLNVIKERTGMSDKQSMRAFQYGFAPSRILTAFVNKNKTLPDADSLREYNRKRFIKYIRKQLLTVHLRRGKRCFRLFGITFYNEVKL